MTAMGACGGQIAMKLGKRSYEVTKTVVPDYDRASPYLGRFIYAAPDTIT